MPFAKGLHVADEEPPISGHSDDVTPIVHGYRPRVFVRADLKYPAKTVRNDKVHRRAAVLRASDYARDKKAGCNFYHHLFHRTSALSRRVYAVGSKAWLSGFFLIGLAFC